MAISKVGPMTLYLGAEVVFASVDRGAHWRVISPDLTGKTAGAPRCGGDPSLADAKACGYGGIWSLAPSPRQAGELWVGTDDGLVQLTRDGGAHWSNVTPPAVPAWAKIASLEVSSLVDGTAYIAVDNQRQSDLAPRAYVTRDYGATWQSAAGDLPSSHFVSVVRADTERPGLIYAGTDVGVFASFDEGAHWRSIQGNLPTAWVRDLTIKGDDLVAATQGRALWIHGDLALLRQGDAPLPRSALHLFRPAAAVRVRANENRDTPLPAEEPSGENPPAGAVIDYWLAERAAGPVTIDIRDSAGALVQRLSSEDRARPPAAEYFSADWARPPAPPGSAAGPHQVVWNLRWKRPSTIAYAYSIAAAAGRETPIVPEGPLALPGVYQVFLKVGAREEHVALTLMADPRAALDPAALASTLALSRKIADGLAVSRRGYGETAFVQARIKALGASPRDPVLTKRFVDLSGRMGPALDSAGFVKASEILAGVETDLESSDIAPTAAQTSVAETTLQQIERLDARWSAVKGDELAVVNLALARASLKPIVLPAADKLDIPPPDAGDDLP